MVAAPEPIPTPSTPAPPGPASLPLRSRYIRQVESLEQDVLRIGAMVEHSCRLARTALIDGDLDAPSRIDVQDKAVDSLYRRVEQDSISLVALQSPVGRDLRLISALMQISRDLERIGDYAEDLGELAVRLFPHRPHPLLPRLAVMLDRARSLLALGLESLTQYDPETGLDLKRLDDAVDQDYEELFELLVHNPHYQLGIESTAVLVLAIRCIERMADHATNIGKRVFFIENGHIPV